MDKTTVPNTKTGKERFFVTVASCTRLPVSKEGFRLRSPFPICCIVEQISGLKSRKKSGAWELFPFPEEGHSFGSNICQVIALNANVARKPTALDNPRIIKPRPQEHSRNRRKS